MTNKIKTFFWEDENLRAFGLPISSDFSRKIILLLQNKSLFAHQIAEILQGSDGLKLPTTTTQLKKLVQCGLVTFENKQEDLIHTRKFYSSGVNIVVVLPKRLNTKDNLAKLKSVLEEME